MEVKELMSLEQIINAIGLGAALAYFLIPTFIVCFAVYIGRRTRQRVKIKKKYKKLLKEQQEKVKVLTNNISTNTIIKGESMRLEFDKNGEIKRR
jgi:hypothetical protein